MLNQNLAAHFFNEANFRPLLLPFNEVKVMKDVLGDAEGTLIVCPVFSYSDGIPEPIVMLRYILYKKDENNYTPLRFDFKPVFGSIEAYYPKLKNASMPNFEIPSTLPNQTPNPQEDPRPSLVKMFSFVTETTLDANGNALNTNENNYFSFFLQKNEDQTLSLHTTVLEIKGGGGDPGVPNNGAIISSGPPPKPSQNGGQ